MRSVPLNDSALHVLDQLDTEGEFDHLFVNRQTRQPYTTIMKVWERLRAKAGLPKLRIHDLRHAYASLLVSSGRTLYEVQQILGHSDPKVTMRYSHLSAKSLQDAASSASVIVKATPMRAAARRCGPGQAYLALLRAIAAIGGPWVPRPGATLRHREFGAIPRRREALADESKSS